MEKERVGEIVSEGREGGAIRGVKEGGGPQTVPAQGQVPTL